MRSIQSVLKSYTSYRHRYVLTLLSACCAIVLTVPLHVVTRLTMSDTTSVWVWTGFTFGLLCLALFVGLAMALDEQLVSASDLAELPSELREAAYGWLSGSPGLPLSWGDLRQIVDKLHHEAFLAARKRTAQAALDHQRAAINAPALPQGQQP